MDPLKNLEKNRQPNNISISCDIKEPKEDNLALNEKKKECAQAFKDLVKQRKILKITFF